MAGHTYSPGVKIGNWSEDRSLHEERVAKFLEQKETGNLSFLKTQSAVLAATASVSLSSQLPGTLCIGDRIQLRHTASNAVLCNVEGEDNVDVTAAIGDSTAASLRNVFTVVSMDGASEGEPVVYGRKVALRCGNATGDVAYLASDRAGPHSRVAHFSGEQMVYLLRLNEGETVTSSAAWVFDCHDASVRPENQGAPVPTDAAVIIRHSNSAECLACLHEQRKKYFTTFGAEGEVTCSTKKAGSVMGEFVVKPENVWQLSAN